MPIIYLFFLCHSYYLLPYSFSLPSLAFTYSAFRSSRQKKIKQSSRRHIRKAISSSSFLRSSLYYVILLFTFSFLCFLLFLHFLFIFRFVSFFYTISLFPFSVLYFSPFSNVFASLTFCFYLHYHLLYIYICFFFNCLYNLRLIFYFKSLFFLLF